METVWLVNGERRDVPPSDRGLAYGDGLFETMAVVNGRIHLLEYHFERLESGCRRLLIPPIAREALHTDLERLLPSDAGRYVAKIIVTRGSSGRGYRPPADPAPLRIVSVSPWPDYPEARYETGVDLVRCMTTLGENEALAGLKHLCRLEQVLGQIEVQRAGAVEGIMCTRHGDVIGGTMSNIFVVSSDTVLTPSLTTCGVAGVMRRAVMERAAALGIGVETGQLTYSMLTQAQEIFLTNAVFGIWPVRALGEQQFPIGAVTRRFMKSLLAPATGGMTP